MAACAVGARKCSRNDEKCRNYEQVLMIMGTHEAENLSCSTHYVTPVISA